MFGDDKNREPEAINNGFNRMFLCESMIKEKEENRI
jgi:hypothetical protein